MSDYMQPGFHINNCDLAPKGFADAGTLTHLLPLTNFPLNMDVAMCGYSVRNNSILQPKLPENGVELDALRLRNNPNNEPVGNHTGRCAHCGSNDLWDDNLAYGCNVCHALLGGN